MNEYASKAAQAGYAYGAGGIAGAVQNQGVASGPAIERPALEVANDRLQSLIQTVALIDANLSSFLSRAGGGHLSLPEEKDCTNSPTPSAALPQLGERISALNMFINRLGERVNKLNQIA